MKKFIVASLIRQHIELPSVLNARMSDSRPKSKNSREKITLPMLPMRDIVVFPHMTAPFFIGRPLSITALEEALSKDRKIFVVAQEDPLVEEPEEKNLFRMGTIGCHSISDSKF